ncbi:unnamed protein product [Cylicocyclus nassatus]|uniref:Uncharacterized protein n=1 Tax=Cylicocyclus nassatus TaxID=53992 RepID=A0AA36GKT2_CYLNA|nr:unnamed protein product [Cylicocyclus nassatus]
MRVKRMPRRGIFNDVRESGTARLIFQKDEVLMVDLSKVVMRSDPKQEIEHVQKNVDGDRKSVQRAVCYNFAIGVLVTLLLLSVPVAEAGYIPSEDDSPINMVLNKLGFALLALAPARPAKSSAPESRQPLIVNPHHRPRSA